MSAVAERSVRSPCGGASRRTTTSKSTDWAEVEPLRPRVPPWIELWAISVTRPANTLSGKASISMPALSPIAIWGISVSSTSSTASISARSATVSSTVPGLFIVPTIAVSPCSTLSRVMSPVIGAVITVFASRSRASRTLARAWATWYSAASNSACCTS